MKPERLQEIKDRAYHEASTTEELGWKLNTDKMFDDIRKLIAAYENQGELLQLSLANVDRLNEELKQAQAELAENKEKLTRARRYLEQGNKGRNVFLERIVDLREQLEEKQAENERLRNIRGFTPDAARDK